MYANSFRLVVGVWFFVKRMPGCHQDSPPFAIILSFAFAILALIRFPATPRHHGICTCLWWGFHSPGSTCCLSCWLIIPLRRTRVGQKNPLLLAPAPAPAYTLTCTRYRDMQFAMSISPRGARNFNCPHTVWEQKNGGKSHSLSPQMCFRAFAFRLGQAQTHTNFGPQCPRLPLDLLNLPKPTNDRWARPFDSSHRFQLNGHGQERLDLFMARPRRESFVLGPRHQMSFF